MRQHPHHPHYPAGGLKTRAAREVRGSSSRLNVAGIRLTPSHLHPPPRTRPATCTGLPHSAHRANRSRAGAPHLRCGLGWQRTFSSSSSTLLRRASHTCTLSLGYASACGVPPSARPCKTDLSTHPQPIHSRFATLHAFPSELVGVASRQLAPVVHGRQGGGLNTVASTPRAPNRRRSHETSSFGAR